MHTWLWNRWQQPRVLPFIALIFAAGLVGRAQTSVPSSQSHRDVLYAAVGPDLTWYDMDVEHATLAKRGSVTLPANVEEAWAHPSKQYLYVAWSSRSPTYGSGSTGSQHGVSAFHIDRASGALRPLGKPLSMQERPIYLATDVPGRHLLVAHNVPSGISVHRIDPDGALGAEVTPPAPLDVGIYGHQVRVDPSNKIVVLVTRGNSATPSNPGDPGSVQVFAFENGLLRNNGAIAPGKDFNARNLDFHPSRPWAFVTLATQSKVLVYRVEPDGRLNATPLFAKDTLAEPGNVQRGQVLGNIRVHPNGRYLYTVNRAAGTTDVEGERVFVGGENTIVVYEINQQTGEPVHRQSIDTRGMHARAFAFDENARIFVAANQMSVPVREGTRVNVVPASLALFRMNAAGTLEFIRKYDVETGGSRQLFWTGIVSLP